MVSDRPDVSPSDESGSALGYMRAVKIISTRTKYFALDMDNLYETDFHAWTQQQSELLQIQAWDLLDIANLIEELESLGNKERQELKSCLRVLLGHLLKWQYQPQKRSNSWMATIREQREEVLELLERNPSLKPFLETAVVEAYPKGVHLAVQETNLPYEAFPAICPYFKEQVLASDFWS